MGSFLKQSILKIVALASFPGALVASPLYFHADHLGSTSVATDEGGNVQQVAIYSPYGEVLKDLKAGGIQATAYLYTGQELDRESNLSYYGARYYDPATARFISTDPARTSFNLYEYGRQNPVTYVDPDGRAARPLSSEDQAFYGERREDLSPKLRDYLDGIARSFDFTFVKSRVEGPYEDAGLATPGNRHISLDMAYAMFGAPKGSLESLRIFAWSVFSLARFVVPGEPIIAVKEGASRYTLLHELGHALPANRPTSEFPIAGGELAFYALQVHLILNDYRESGDGASRSALASVLSDLTDAYKDYQKMGELQAFYGPIPEEVQQRFEDGVPKYLEPPKPQKITDYDLVQGLDEFGKQVYDNNLVVKPE